MGFKLELDIGSECGGECGGQTNLGTWLTLYNDNGIAEAHENRGCVEIFIIPPHLSGIVLHRLPSG